MTRAISRECPPSPPRAPKAPEAAQAAPAMSLRLHPLGGLGASGAYFRKVSRFVPQRAQPALQADRQQIVPMGGGSVVASRGNCDGRKCLDHLVGRGQLGYEAFGADERSLGIFPSQREAAAAIIGAQ